jgi:hypothetical protein
VGVYTCIDSNNCGRALGQYQTMSNAPNVVTQVSQVAGGEEWLTRLSQGELPTEAEMMQYYPPQMQKQVFEQEISLLIQQTEREIDPKTGQFFSGDRLIERVAQKWLGGVASLVDSTISDSNNQLSLYDYGVLVSQYYHASGGNPNCPL